MIVYIEFTNQQEGENKLQENSDYLGLPRPHILDNMENPDITWDVYVGSLMTNPNNSKVALAVNFDEIYNAHTDNPIPVWKPNIFDGYTQFTESEIIAKGYFEGDE